MNRLQPVSANTSRGFFRRTEKGLSRWLASSGDAEWTNLEGWGRDIACQLPVDALKTTAFYYEAKGVHFSLKPGAEIRTGVLQWLRDIWRGTKLLEEKEVTSKMQLLTLHCPSVSGCKTKFGHESSSASEGGFHIEVVGFGGGTTHTSKYDESLLLSTEEQCVQIWMPVTYMVRKYQITRVSAEEGEATFYTVDPVGLGEDMEVRPSACGNGACAAVRSFHKPQQSFSLVPGSVLEKSIAYEVGAAATASVDIDLPLLAKASLEVRVVFSYKVNYSFQLRGPGRFVAHEISYLPVREEIDGRHLALRRCLIRSPGYAWRWGAEASE